MKIGSFCSGYGGLELAVETITGGHTVWQSETDPHASTVLAHRWPGVPNHGDLTTVDWSLAEPVDVVTAGYPCQPFSTAGRRGGENDARHIWPHIIGAVRILGPRLVLLENVSGHLSLGFGQVLGDLAEAGYDTEWRCLRASDVGAPHRRERVFICAHLAADSEHDGWDGATVRRSPSPSEDQGRLLESERCSPADTLSGAAQLRRGPRPVGSPPPTAPSEGDQRQRGGHTAGGGQAAADTDGAAGPQRDLGPVGPGQRASRRMDARGRGVCVAGPFGAYQSAVDRWAAILGRPAPPGLRDGRLNERFVEWMMGLPDGWVTDHVARRHALRILGNGVVPRQAEAAYRSLLGSEMEVAA